MGILSRGATLLFLCFFFPFSAQAINPLDVIFNEIAWMGTNISANDEWIELYNNTENPINLDGWQLVSQGGTPKISLSGIIPANGFYLLERTDDNTVPEISADKIYTGALGNNGELLKLYDLNGNLIEEVDCSVGWFAGNNKTKQTMERKNSQLPGNDPNSWQVSQNPGGTPKAKNSLVIQTEPQPKTKPNETAQGPITYPAAVVINEILPSPEGPDEQEEWIEIFNQNSFEVDLSGWQIADTVGRTITYAFPVGTKISGQGLLVLRRPETKIALNNDEEGLLLLQPNGNILDSANYQKAPRGQSYHRTESGWAWSSSLTPGSVNVILTPVSKIKEGEKKETLPKELAAVSESFRQTQGKQISKSLFTLVIALGLAIFSGAIILTFKRKIKT